MDRIQLVILSLVFTLRSTTLLKNVRNNYNVSFNTSLLWLKKKHKLFVFLDKQILRAKTSHANMSLLKTGPPLAVVNVIGTQP